MGQQHPAKNLDNFSPPPTTTEEEVNQQWAERILLWGLQRSGKTLFIQTLKPDAVLDKDLLESVSGTVLQHILLAMKYVYGGCLDELLMIVKGNENVSNNLNRFIKLHVDSHAFLSDRSNSFTDLLLELWNYRLFVDFYYTNLDRFNFHENLELFIERVKQFRIDSIIFNPFTLISKESHGYTEVVKELNGNSITLIENRGSRPDTKFNAKKVILLMVSLSDCMISVKDESNLLDFPIKSATFSEGKFQRILHFFEDICKSRALKDYQHNTRLCILFTKADLFMKRLEKCEQFPRHRVDSNGNGDREKEELYNRVRSDEIATLRNSFKERQIVNYIVNEFEQTLCSSIEQEEGMNVEFDYHIINALNEEEVNGVFELLVKPLNQRGVVKHFISPCLKRPLEYLSSQLYSHLIVEKSFIDVTVIVFQ